MTFQPREDDESLAMHLHRNAEALGATTSQIVTLRVAARMSMKQRSAADRAEAGRIAEAIRDELLSGQKAAVYAAQARGEKVEDFNDAGAVRVKGRDGLVSLGVTQALTEQQVTTALAYRALYEAARLSAVGSQLGRLGETSRGQRSSTTAMVRHGLHLAYAGVQLTEAEAVLTTEQLLVLRAVAGEGRTVGSLATSGHRRQRLTAALAAALDAVRKSFGVTGGLRITGS